MAAVKTEDDPLITNHNMSPSTSLSSMSGGAISAVPEERDEMTVQEILDEIGFTPIHVFYTVGLGILGMLEFVQTSSLAFVIPSLTCAWDLNGAEQGLAVSFSLLGVALGSIGIGPIADKIGRKPPALVVSVTSFMLLALIAAFARNIYVFTLLSTGTGLCTGAGFAICLTYWSEVSATHWRRTGTLIIIVFWATGFTSTTLLGYTVLTDYDWETYLYACSLFGILSFLIILCLPDSPKYLSMADKELEARASLKRICCSSKVYVDIDEVAIKKEEMNKKPRLIESVKFICSSDLKWDGIRMAGLLSCSKSSVKSLFFMLTAILSSNYCNLSDKGPIATKTNKCEILTKSDFVFGFYFAFFEYLTCFGAIFLTKLIGHILAIKVLAGIGLASTILLLFCMPVTLLLIIEIIMFMSVFGITVSMFTFLPQIFPTKARNSGMGMVSGISVTLTSIILFVMVTVLSYSIKGAIGILICLTAGLNVQVWLPGLRKRIDEVTAQDSKRNGNVRTATTSRNSGSPS